MLRTSSPDKPMRVLLISHTCQSRLGGQPKAAHLGRIPGMQLKVLVPDRWREYGKWRGADRPLDTSYEYQVGRVQLPWAGPAQWYLHFYPQLARILRAFQPDIIDLWEEPWGLVSAQACALRNRLLPHAKIIAETEQNINKFLPPPFETFRAYTLRNADFVIGRNAAAVEILRSKGYQGPSAVVPNAVDADLFRPLDRARCRENLGLSGFVAGYVGRLVEEKGLMDMVDALAQTPADVNLLFVGAGPYQPALEQRIRERGWENRVRFLPNRPLEELPQVMNALDALVLPSRTTARWKEQFGRVLIEAQACQTPVIGSDSGAIPEVIGQAGMVVPEGSVDALAQAMIALRSAPERAGEMGRLGRRRVEENYTWAQVAERMRGIYQPLLEGPSSSSASLVSLSRKPSF